MRLLPARDAQYRRGTIMGLTAAEAFMLICFILLLIISLWQRQSLDKLQAANEELKRARVFQDSFTEKQRLAAVTYKDVLEDLGDSLQKVKSFEELLAESGGEAQFRETLQTLREVQDVPSPEVVERVRLLDDRLVRQVAAATAELPPETKRRLAELSNEERFKAMVEVAYSSPEALVRSIDRLKEFEALGLSPAEIEKTVADLAAYGRLGMDPEQVKDLAVLASEVDGLTEEVAAFRATGLTPGEAQKLASAVDQLRTADAQSGSDIAAAIRTRAGDLISEMGGQILENGSVTFPEGVLFDPGKSNLKPDFDAVLSRFCRPWLEVLRGFDESLRNVQIEGHASSEWNDAPLDVAFIKNLGLSQARAAVVFQRCLDYVGNDELGTWARTRLAAVGYSSSRPVLAPDNSEDRVRSRRVVFALDVKSAEDLIIDDILSDQPSSAPPSASTDALVPDDLLEAATTVSGALDFEALEYERVDGQITSVVDGDTLFIGTRKVRLQGLHAPELSDPRGRDAKDYLQRSVLGRSATCWMTGRTTYDRSEGICQIDGLDVAAIVISNGLGRDCPGFSKGRYQLLESLVEYPATLPLPEYCVD